MKIKVAERKVKRRWLPQEVVLSEKDLFPGERISTYVRAKEVRAIFEEIVAAWEDGNGSIVIDAARRGLKAVGR